MSKLLAECDRLGIAYRGLTPLQFHGAMNELMGAAVAEDEETEEAARLWLAALSAVGKR